MRPLIKPILLISLLILFKNIAGAQAPAMTLYPIVWKWLGGKSDSLYLFKESEHPKLINNLKNAYQVKRAREYWYNKNLNTFNSGQRTWSEVNNFSGRFQTLRGVFRAGFDMVEQTIGGFTVHITPIGTDSIEFTLVDLKSRWSLFLHLPFIKNIPYASGAQVQRNMSNSYWVFTWRESVENLYFQQRIYNTKYKKRKPFTGHNF